jgi:hypothetical protein
MPPAIVKTKAVVPTFDPVKEYEKCSGSFVYFVENYVRIKHPEKGIIPFRLYDFQKEICRLFVNEQNVVVNKSRQVGLSTLTSAFCLWIAMFQKHKTVMIISKTDDDAGKFLSKVTLAYDELPKWLRNGVPTVKRNVHHFELATGSIVEAEAAGPQAGRSESLSLLVMDEAAFIPRADSIWTAAAPTLSRGNGKCIIISTPNGIGNYFADIVDGAKKKTINPEYWNGFNYFFCHWKDVPEYTQEWYVKMRPKFTDRQWAQEFEGEFVGSGNNVIPVETLRSLKNILLQPQIKRNAMMEPDPNGDLWIWEKPQPGRAYIVGSDIATGDGGDFSTIEIFDVASRKQVAEYKGKAPLRKFVKLIFDVCTWYNEAYLILESNTYGAIVLKDLIEIFGYSNMYYYRNPNTGQIKFRRAGFHNTAATRSRIVDGIQQTFKMFRIVSERLFEEALTFVWIEGKAKHSKGRNDDALIACGLAVGNLDAMLEDDPNVADAVYQAIKESYGKDIMSQDEYIPISEEEMEKEFNTLDGEEEIEGSNALTYNSVGPEAPPAASFYGTNDSFGDEQKPTMVYRNGILQPLKQNTQKQSNLVYNDNTMENEFGFGFLGGKPN